MSFEEVAIVDPATIDELRASTGDDEEFLRELIQSYLQDTPPQLEAIEAAVGAADAAALVRPAHTLKSSSASVGALRLSAIAKSLELAGREGRIGGLAEEVAAAMSAWPLTQAGFRELGLAE
jgi:HPt (histidine-containing phosphotransfer) domain-containing protein